MKDDAVMPKPAPRPRPDHPARSLTRLAVCLALCAAIALAGGLSTAPQIPGWYASLTKPSWTPPNAVFPIVWPILYAMIAFALWRLWDRAGRSAARDGALALLVANLALNALWSPVFFAAHEIGAGLAIILFMIVTLAATILRAANADRPASLLLVPYFAWICFAAALNGAIAQLNP